MLFDLRGRGRRRTVQVIYGTLAILMGGGLVFFGIGGEVQGGLFDAFSDSSGNTSGNQIVEDKAKKAEERVKANPKDAAALAELARLRFQLAGTGDNFNQEQGSYTEDGLASLRQSARAWERYLALKPAKVDSNVAILMVNVYAGLGQAEKAVGAQEIVVEAQATPNVGQYLQLARLAYAAGQTRKGDLARTKVLELAPADQREILKEQLDEAKKPPTSAGAGGATDVPSGGTQTVPAP